jgi:superfamily II DNA or RNA helicase/predicted house-cleaning noncanonical NTP pyrophosphatase (MazG superfamily)
MAPRYRKLIRDHISEIAARDGQQLDVFSITAEPAFDLLLARKLVEESAEVLDALMKSDRQALLLELADLRTVIDTIATRAGIKPKEIIEAVANKLNQRGGFKQRLVLQEKSPRPVRLFAGGSTSLLETLRHELSICRAASFAVSFVMDSGLDAIEGAIRAALLRGIPIRLLTTDYLDVTSPTALRRLIQLHGNLDVRAFSHSARSFHPKAYLFDHGNGDGRAYVGSANLSRSGLTTGVEWTWMIRSTDLGHPMDELFGEFDTLFESSDSSVISPSWIDQYEARRRPHTESDAEIFRSVSSPSPRPVQQLALAELSRLRLEGERRAMVIAATGLGKTWLAAFDVRGFSKVLFICHREELLQQASKAFAVVHPKKSIGFAIGNQFEIDCDLVFGTIQTLSKQKSLEDPRLASFDYIVIDEFHHAAASSYTTLLDRLYPQFLLGLTATPYRGDNRDLYALCNGNVAYKIQLFEAIAMGWLCPFRYLGIADTIDYDASLIKRSGSGYDEKRLSERYRDPARTKLIVDRFLEHKGQAALGFCVSIEHAEFMASAFTNEGIKALALHSQSPSGDRASAIERLELGKISIIFTVDLFNEGVDIPCVDLVLFLRPTESMTVFLQQLGRGLRLHDRKKQLTVIDLIGNYRNVQIKLPFLVGLNDEDPESLKQAMDKVRRWIQHGERPADIPATIEIEIDEIAVDRLEQALRDGDSRKKQLAEAFAEVTRSLGRRPSLSELDLRGRFAAAHYLSRTGWGSWYGTLKSLAALTPEEIEVERVCGEFLKEIETTALTRSYKMVVLQAMLDRGALPGNVSLPDLMAHFREHFSKETNYAELVGTRIENVTHVANEVLGQYIVDNPLNAWIGGNTRRPSQWFSYDPAPKRFQYTGPRPEQLECFKDAVSERVRYRLMQYRHRKYAADRYAKVIPNNSGACIMIGKDRTDGLPRSGWHLVDTGHEYLYAKFASIAVNVIKSRPVESIDEPNIIVEVLKALFNDVDLLDFRRAYRMRFVKAAGQDAWLMVPT